MKVPAWLNSPIYYHNRGNSDFAGESSLDGDFFGLDDLMTENPRVVQGFIDIYGDWIERYGIDGFRIDTARHVNPEFWQAFIPAMLNRARTRGIPNFHIFGEVAAEGVDVAQLARHTRVDKLPSVLDFAFANAVNKLVAGSEGTSLLARLYQDDGLYEGGAAAAMRLPMFTGNHDFGRLAWIIRAARPNATDDEVLKRVMLGNAMMFLLRGVPVVYYGDEQGFVGHGIDQDARQDLFASRVASYNDQTLLGSSATTAVANFNQQHPLYAQIAGLAKLRQEQPALQHGRQIVRAHGTTPGLFAASRLSSRWPRARGGVQHVEGDGGVADRSGSHLGRVQIAAWRLRGEGQRARQLPRGSAAVGLRRLPGSGAVKLRFVFVTLLSVWPRNRANAQVVDSHATDASIRSPGGTLAVALRVNGEGRPEYSIARNGQPLVNWSRLGFILADAPKLERNFELERIEQKAIDDTWEQPWGERRYVRNHCAELRVSLREKTGAQRQLTVVFRVFDDGVGFRYEFPEQPALSQVNIVQELTEFDIAESATAWWIPGGEWNRYEYLYQKTPLAEVAQAHTPLTLKTASGVHIAIHEAALVDYSAMWLRRVSGQRLKAVLSPSSSGPAVSRKAPFVTPWRTLQIASSAPGLYMSDLILNLNEPNKLGDVSWVKPFKYVGIWWGMHLGTKTWASGPETWRDDRRNEALHRLRGPTSFSRRARGRLEQGLGRRLVRQGRRVQLHRGVSGLRHRGAGGVREEEGRAPGGSPRNRRQHRGL